MKPKRLSKEEELEKVAELSLKVAQSTSDHSFASRLFLESIAASLLALLTRAKDPIVEEERREE